MREVGEKGEGSGGKGGGNWEWGTPLSTPSTNTEPPQREQRLTGDPWDGIFYPILTLMMDSYIITIIQLSIIQTTVLEWTQEMAELFSATTIILQSVDCSKFQVRIYKSTAKMLTIK